MTATPIPAPRPRHRLRRLPLKVTALLVGAAVLGAALLTFHAAFAARAGKGINRFEFGSRPDVCLPGQALPCLPDAGTGRSNTIYVKQHLVDGEYRYDEIVGTGHGGDIWLQTTLAGKCASNYRLSSLRIDPLFIGDEAGQVQEVHEYEYPAPFPLDQPVDSGNRTLPTRNVAVHLPPDLVVDELMLAAPVDLFGWGEQRIADRVEAGTSEHNARVEPYTKQSHVGMNAVLSCRKVTNDLKRPYVVDSTWHPVEIVWLGIGMEPGDETDDGWRDGLLPDDPRPEPVEPELTVGFQVTQAHLSALSDPQNPCLLHLSGVVTTTEPGVVRYRYLDELGRHSQLFAVEVDQTLTAFFSSEVELVPVVVEPPLADGDPDGLVATGDGQIGGLVQEQGDNVQGYYQLEVVEPHTKRSTIASYNVDGCEVTPEGPDTKVAEPAPSTPDDPSVPGVIVDPAPQPDPLTPPSGDLAPTSPTPPPPSGPTEMILVG